MVDNEDDGLVVDKIEALLATTSTTTASTTTDESLLVALLLWNRLSSDTAFQQIRKKYHTILVEYCERLFVRDQDATDDENQTALQSLLLRLLVQLCNRCLDCSLAGEGEKGINSLLKIVWDEAQKRRLRKLPLDLVDVQVLEVLSRALEAGLLSSRPVVEGETTSFRFGEEHALSLWDMYIAFHLLSKDGRRMSENRKISSPPNELEDPEALMIQTLSSILRRDEIGLADDALINAWDDSCTRCLQCFSLASSRIPLFWGKVLEWWAETVSSTQKKSSDDARRRHTNWAMMLLQMLILHNSNEEQIAHFRQMLSGSKGTQISRHLAKLFLASVISESDETSLRSLAWVALNQLIESMGWDWLFSGQSDARREQQNITALIRMAVGEWRIQLGYAIGLPPETPLSEERQILVQATGRIVVQSLKFVAQMADESSSDSSILPASSVQHLRRSLEEALDTVIQYLGSTEIRRIEVDTSVLQVIGALLTEFDVFDHRQNAVGGAKSDGETKDENDFLQSVRVAVMIAGTSQQREYLVPGLAYVYGSADGDNQRVQQLKDFLLLGDDVVDFFISCLVDVHNTMATIPWICQTIELFSSMGSKVDVSRFQRGLMQWIRGVLSSSDISSSDTLTAIEAAVGCYVTLQGDDPPDEADSSILQQALELCALARHAR